MSQLPLRKYMIGKKQDVVARTIGVTQGALSQMLKGNRRIYIEVDDEGCAVDAFEIKAVGKGITLPESAKQPA